MKKLVSSPFLRGLFYFLPLLFLFFLVFKDSSPSSLFPAKENNDLRESPSFTAEKDFLPWLATKGRFIVNEDGQPVILRGVNLCCLSWGEEAWFPKAIEEATKNWGANVIRTRIYQDDYFKDSEAFFDKLNRVIIEPAKRNKAYVILNPWIGKNESLPNEQTYLMWQEIARRYQDEPAVIYDVLAEPHDVSRAAVWQANQKLVEAIRVVHPKSLIMVTGLGWGREINSYLDNPLPYENIIYRTNPYNKAGEFESIFGKIARFYPVFLGEFGADGYPPMSQESVQALLSLADRFSLSWTAWNFHDSGCPCLLVNNMDFSPSIYGQIVKNALAREKTIQEIVLPPATQNLVIYADNLENAFVDLSWDAQVDLQNEENIFGGQKAIKVAINKPYGAFYLSSYLFLETSSYQNLVFSLKTSASASLVLQVIDQDSQPLKEISLAEFIKPNNWQEIKIPLSALGAADRRISGLLIKDSQGAPATFWLDEIYLEKKSS
jgi:hypothetical protein